MKARSNEQISSLNSPKRSNSILVANQPQSPSRSSIGSAGSLKRSTGSLRVKTNNIGSQSKGSFKNTNMNQNSPKGSFVKMASGAIFALPGEIAEDLPADSPDLGRSEEDKLGMEHDHLSSIDHPSSNLPSAIMEDVSSPGSPTFMGKMTFANGIPASPSRSSMVSDSAVNSPVKSHSAARLARRDSVSAASLTPTLLQSTDLTPIEDDRGRVKVFVRIRPLTEQERTTLDPSKPTLQVNENFKEIHLTDNKREYDLNFDHVFDEKSKNKDIFLSIGKPVADAAMNGFNGTLMAYGQTGTGKTYTLTSSDGLTPRLINYVFRKTHLDQKHDYKITCSYIQIYNEKIYDLLANENKTGKNSGTEVELNLRESPEKGVYIEDLTEYVVQSPKEVFELVKLGRSRLIFAETKMNRASSRSHAICFLTIEKTFKKIDKQEGTVTSEVPTVSDEKAEGTSAASQDLYGDVEDDDYGDLDQANNSETSDVLHSGNDILVRGRLTICDLAGSERIKKTHATGDRLSEAQQINLSLLELGNVIHALTDSKRQHVPFRNSTLTRLLQESLGGNCKTSLIVCVSPSTRDISETKGTLAFGYRAMRVKNCARVNVEVDYKALADALAQQIGVRDAEWRKREQELLDEIQNLLDKQLHVEAHKQKEIAIKAELETLREKLALMAKEAEMRENAAQHVVDHNSEKHLMALKSSMETKFGELNDQLVMTHESHYFLISMSFLLNKVLTGNVDLALLLHMQVNKVCTEMRMTKTDPEFLSLLSIINGIMSVYTKYPGFPAVEADALPLLDSLQSTLRPLLQNLKNKFFSVSKMILEELEASPEKQPELQQLQSILQAISTEQGYQVTNDLSLLKMLSWKGDDCEEIVLNVDQPALSLLLSARMGLLPSFAMFSIATLCHALCTTLSPQLNQSEKQKESEKLLADRETSIQQLTAEQKQLKAERDKLADELETTKARLQQVLARGPPKPPPKTQDHQMQTVETCADIDAYMEREAARKAALCSVGGKPCSIM